MRSSFLLFAVVLGLLLIAMPSVFAGQTAVCAPVETVTACDPVETVEVCAPADCDCCRCPGPIVKIAAATVNIATAPARAIRTRVEARAVCGACDPVACAPVETVEVCAPADNCCQCCRRPIATLIQLPIKVVAAPVRAAQARVEARCTACPCDPVEAVEVCAPCE